jgi:hypothetical protein
MILDDSDDAYYRNMTHEAIGRLRPCCTVPIAQSEACGFTEIESGNAANPPELPRALALWRPTLSSVG